MNDATARLVEQINQAHGLRLAVRNRFSGGEQGGAWLVQAEGCSPLVLKWHSGRCLAPPRQVMRAVNRINAAGYPTPRFRLVGRTPDDFCYHLQDFVPGEPVSLTPHTAGLLIEVIEKQADLAPKLNRDRSAFIRSQAFGLNDDDSARRFVRGLGPDGLDLLARYDEILPPYDLARLPTSDLVHGDFGTGNILVHEGRISGIVDIGALGTGTRVIDYAWLIREAFATGSGRPTADLLRRAAEAVAGREVLVVCIAATAFDMTRWVARHYSASDLAGFLSRMHDLADYLSEPLSTVD